MLYHLYDLQLMMVAPWRMAAEATLNSFQNPFMPVAYSQYGRTIAATAELFERTTRRFSKPVFGLHNTTINGQSVAVSTETVLTKPFANLLHFKRDTTLQQPKLLVVAPMSGHHATLLRGTVATLMQDHDVYITDWIDAKLVPAIYGRFNLEDYVTYVMEFLRFLGPETHLLAVCQPSVPVMAAVAVMAAQDDPAQPRSMTLMGGPIDTRAASTQVTELAEKRPLDWFARTVVTDVPAWYPGAGRRVYPGFMQLTGFMTMNLDRHVGEHTKLFQHLVQGDGESAETHRKFYDEYLAVMDVTGEFYLQTVQMVFQEHSLPKGDFWWRDQRVRLDAIRKTALFCVEGELDDISAPGQTLAALGLCSGLPDSRKQYHLQKGAGHYGIFNGRRWRDEIYPLMRDFILRHDSAYCMLGAKPDEKPDTPQLRLVSTAGA